MNHLFSRAAAGDAWARGKDDAAKLLYTGQGKVKEVESFQNGPQRGRWPLYSEPPAPTPSQPDKSCYVEVC